MRGRTGCGLVNEDAVEDTEEDTTGDAAGAEGGAGAGASCALAKGEQIELSRIIHAKHLDAEITTFSIQYS
jgi:hypothetical protein